MKKSIRAQKNNTNSDKNKGEDITPSISHETANKIAENK